MNIPRKSGLILALAFAFSLPFAASAEEASGHAGHSSTPAAAAEQPAAQPMSSMQDMMREMRRDPSNCKTMPGASAGTPASMPGMGMMGMGAGKGGMHDKNCKMGGMQAQDKPCMQGQDKSCMQGQHMNCSMRGGADDPRLDMLEKRVDMMQMMMEMMMRSGGRH